jgi:agmatine deiminase
LQTFFTRMVDKQKPGALGYRMPAEWEPHAATWLAWPHYHGDWPGKFEPIPWVYAEIIRHLARNERVDLIVKDARAQKQARKLLEQADAFSANVRFHRWPTNRAWMRDSGCIFLTAMNPNSPRLDRRERALSPSKGRLSSEEMKSHPLIATKWRFNAWAKYSNHRYDEKVGSLMAQAAGATEIQPISDAGPSGRVPSRKRSTSRRVVLEGGSIDVNGRGTLITTEECLLSQVQQRNPGMSRDDYEKLFADYLGAPNVIWLGAGIAGDDTHGHVDDLARFVATGTVVTMVERNSKDVNYKPLRENLRRLKTSRDQDGKLLNVVEIPMPGPVVFEGRRLPASYANFYIANGIVLAPVFNHPNDRIALNTLSDLFPTRSIVPIYSGDLIWGLGTMHCMTQQQPL